MADFLGIYDAGGGQDWTDFNGIMSDMYTANGSTSVDFAAAANVVATHGGITGTLAPGDTVEKSTDTTQTATILQISSTHVFFKMDAGDSFSSGDTIQEIGASGNNITLSSTPGQIDIFEVQVNGGAAHNDSGPNWADYVTGQSATRYLYLRAVPGSEHNGIVAGTNKARFAYSSGSSGGYWMKAADYQITEDLDIYHQYSFSAIRTYLYRGNSVMRRCLIQSLAPSHTGFGFSPANGSYTFKVENCLIYGCTDGWANFSVSSNSVEFYNCSFVKNSRYGIGGAGGGTNNIKLQGCLFIDNATDDIDSTNWTNNGSDYNATHFATGSTSLDSIGGSNNVYEVNSADTTACFVSYNGDTTFTGENFALASTSDAIDITGFTTPGTDWDGISNGRRNGSVASAGFLEYYGDDSNKECVLLCDNTGGAVGKYAHLDDAVTAIGTVDLTPKRTVAKFGHGGITGTLAVGDSLQVNGATSNTASILAISTTAVIIDTIVGEISNGDKLEKVGATSNHLTTNSFPYRPVLVLEHDNFASNTKFSLASITTNQDSYMIIRPSTGNAHDGTAGSGARLVASAGGFSSLLQCNDYLIIEDFEIYNTYTSNFSRAVYKTPNVKLKRCIVHADTTGGYGMVDMTTGGQLLSCLLYGTDNVAVTDDGASTNCKIYGCTIHGTNTASSVAINFSDASSAVEIRGTICTDFDSFYSGSGTDTGDYNASDLTGFTTFPGGVAANNVDQIGDPYTTAGSDFTLAAGATSLHSGWTATPDVAFDILNASRPQSGNASIGAFEYVSAGGASNTRPLLLLGVG
jgi:hypothetical protein